MRKRNSKGSILVLVLLISSVIISTGTALLSTSVMNYRMKKLNSRVKRAFYAAEGALEEAYVVTLDFIEAGVEYAKVRGCSRAAYLNFLLGTCEDLQGHKSLVVTLKDSSYEVCNVSSTSVNATLSSKIDYYLLEIVSTCNDGKIQKSLKLICRILIPDDGFLPEDIDPGSLLCIDDWVSER